MVFNIKKYSSKINRNFNNNNWSKVDLLKLTSTSLYRKKYEQSSSFKLDHKKPV